jgi:hypothetical protein
MTIMEKHASATTYVGSGAAIIGGMSANEIAAYSGIFIGLIGMLVNWYYKAKEDRRAERALTCKQ